MIGDVHGNVAALSGLLQAIKDTYRRVVFVGDYINRGTDSAAVIQLLIDHINVGADLHCLAGNHDTAFLDCLDSGHLTEFLRMGGAATIKSYISSPEPDVLEQLRRMVPGSHRDFLRDLQTSYAEESLRVTHYRNEPDTFTGSRFHVFGHVPQADLVPMITSDWAAIDTGCGTVTNGRLTCLFWPSLEYVQVDAAGQLV